MISGFVDAIFNELFKEYAVPIATTATLNAWYTSCFHCHTELPS